MPQPFRRFRALFALALALVPIVLLTERSLAARTTRRVDAS
jgi:hypothetical protein